MLGENAKPITYLTRLVHSICLHLQNILIEVERYKRQVCGDSDQVYYTRLKEIQYQEDWDVKAKLTVAHGFWRETIFLWKKVPSKSSFCMSASRILAWNCTAAHRNLSNCLLIQAHLVLVVELGQKQVLICAGEATK